METVTDWVNEATPADEDGHCLGLSIAAASEPRWLEQWVISKGFSLGIGRIFASRRFDASSGAEIDFDVLLGLRSLSRPQQAQGTRGGSRAIPDQWPIVDQPRPGAGVETLVHVPEFEFSHNRA